MTRRPQNEDDWAGPFPGPARRRSRWAAVAGLLPRPPVPKTLIEWMALAGFIAGLTCLLVHHA